PPRHGPGRSRGGPRRPGVGCRRVLPPRQSYGRLVRPARQPGAGPAPERHRRATRDRAVVRRSHPACGSPAAAAGAPALTRGLVEGALLAALTVVLSLITAYVPFVQLFSAVMVPAPTVVLAVRHGPRLALLSTVAAGLILFTILGPVGAVLGWLHVAGIGVPLGT